MKKNNRQKKTDIKSMERKKKNIKANSNYSKLEKKLI